MQRHLRADVSQPPHLEVRRAHPGLDRAERVFDRAASSAHQVGVPLHPDVHRLDEMLVLPAGDPPFLAGGASALQRAVLAVVLPVAPQHQAVLLARVAIGQSLAGRAAVDVRRGVVGEVRFHEHALLAVPGRLRPGHGRGDPIFMTGEQFGTVEVAAVGDRIELLGLERCLGSPRHRRQLRPIVADVGDLVGDDQVGVGIDRRLHVVADEAGALAIRRHGAGVGIGQGDLPVRRLVQLARDGLQTPHLLPDPDELLLDPGDLRCVDPMRLLPVDPVHLREIPAGALLQMFDPELYLAGREVPVPVVHRLELAAVDGDAAAAEDPRPGGRAQRNERRPSGSPRCSPCGNRRSSCGPAQAVP